MDKSQRNDGWADAMSKILHTKKPKRKKTIVLSKAKRITNVEKEKEVALPFEVEGDDGEVKSAIEKINKNANESKQGIEIDTKSKRKRSDLIVGIRVKPCVLDRGRERLLQKIATRGVVQLFNTVKQQQEEIKTKLVEAGPLERKRVEVMKKINKNTFLDVLMGGTKSVQVDESLPSKKSDNDTTNKKGNGIWNVLRDDFVMNANLKDWDKQVSESEESSIEEDTNSEG